MATLRLIPPISVGLEGERNSHATSDLLIVIVVRSRRLRERPCVGLHAPSIEYPQISEIIIKKTAILLKNWS